MLPIKILGGQIAKYTTGCHRLSFLSLSLCLALFNTPLCLLPRFSKEMHYSMHFYIIHILILLYFVLPLSAIPTPAPENKSTFPTFGPGINLCGTQCQLELLDTCNSKASQFECVCESKDYSIQLNNCIVQCDDLWDQKDRLERYRKLVCDPSQEDWEFEQFWEENGLTRPVVQRPPESATRQPISITTTAPANSTRPINTETAVATGIVADTTLPAILWSPTPTSKPSDDGEQASVDEESEDAEKEDRPRLATPLIIAISVSSVAFVSLLALAAFFLLRLRKRRMEKSRGSKASLGSALSFTDGSYFGAMGEPNTLVTGYDSIEKRDGINTPYVSSNTMPLNLVPQNWPIAGPSSLHPNPAPVGAIAPNAIARPKSPKRNSRGRFPIKVQRSEAPYPPPTKPLPVIPSESESSTPPGRDSPPRFHASKVQHLPTSAPVPGTPGYTAQNNNPLSPSSVDLRDLLPTPLHTPKSTPPNTSGNLVPPLPANTQSAHQQSNSKTSIEDFLQPPPPTKRKGKGHARDLSTASHVSTSRLLGASNGRTVGGSSNMGPGWKGKGRAEDSDDGWDSDESSLSGWEETL